MIVPSPRELANEVRMTRSQFRGAFLIVEGRDDNLFMLEFISRETCKIIVAYGKQNVCDAIAILDNDRFDGALGMIDSDFDRIEAVPARSRNLVMPECHDLFTMLVSSPALARVLREYGSPEKLDRVGKTPLEALTEVALPIGYLRLHSIRAGMNLRFTDLNYTRWIDARSLRADTRNLIETVKNRSQMHNLSTNDVLEAIADLHDAGYDRREVCVGTDLVEALSIGLRRVLGSRPAAEVRVDYLKSGLRLAYSDTEFRASTLKRDIEHWQLLSPDYQVLRSNI